MSVWGRRRERPSERQPSKLVSYRVREGRIHLKSSVDGRLAVARGSVTALCVNGAWAENTIVVAADDGFRSFQYARAPQKKGAAEE